MWWDPRAQRKGKIQLRHLTDHLAPASHARWGVEGWTARGYRGGMSDASHMAGQGEHPIDEKVLSLMDRRLSSARKLADRASELSEARARLEEAQRAYGSAFKDAEKAGWDRKELTGHLAFEEPGRAPRRRSPRTKSAEEKDSADAPTDDGGTATP